MVAVLAFSSLAFWVPGAKASEPGFCYTCTAAVAGDTGGVSVEHGVSQSVPGRGKPQPASVVGLTHYSYVGEFMSPACTGNSLNGAELLCNGAVSTCPAAGQIRFWIWHQQVDVTLVPLPARAVTGPWLRLPGTFCLGPDAQGIPPVVRVIAAVQDLFAHRHLPLPAWPVRTDPTPRTLINFPTSFNAGSAAPQLIDVTILGLAVHIRAVPQRWAWTFGDGESLVTNVPGRARTEDVTHTYAGLGPMSTQVVVSWGGTFRVGADPQVHDIRTPAVITGPVSTVAVLQARAELVAR